MRLALLIVALVGCAPPLDGPVERQRSLDRADSDRLAAQLARLPGAVHAEVTLHRPLTDPLSHVAIPGSAAIVVVVDDHADRAAVTRSAVALVRGTAPEIREPSIVVELGATRPQLAHVGPFTVEAGDRSRLVATLVIVLSLVIALAGFIAWRERSSRRKAPL